MSLTPLAASFVLVALAELGDKTQIAVISLSSRFKALSVFCVSMLAFLLTTGIAVAIGDALALILPTFWIRILAAVIFLIFGIYTIVSRREETQIQTKGWDSKRCLLLFFLDYVDGVRRQNSVCRDGVVCTV